MSNKTLLSTLVLGLFTLALVMISCNNSGPGGPNLEITEVSPEQGTIGTRVTIYGGGFVPKASDNLVYFDGTAAKVISVSPDSIVTEVPVGAESGPIEVEVDDKTVTGPSFTIISGEDGLAVSSIDPMEGPVGTEVTITGCNFSPNLEDNSVTFNGTSADVISVSGASKTNNEQTETEQSDKNVTSSDSLSSNKEEASIASCGNELVAVVPDGATTGPVEVTVNGETATGPDFTVTDGGGNRPSIDNIDPTEGPTGTEVTITGENFAPNADDNTVKFGDAEANVTEAADTELTAIVPDELNGGDVVPVSVTVDGQTGVGPDFTVTDDGGGGGDAPSIGGIDPTEGPTGTEVTITGENFGPNPEDNTVTFNGSEATISSASETELVVIVPDDATTGPVEVTVDGETATGPEFTVTDDGGGGDAPTVDSINPTEGPTGTEVTITGSNFSSTASENTVEFGNAEANVTAASTTELTAVVPDELNAGDVVTVSVTVDGQTATGPDFTVTDDGSGGDAPSIGGIDPTEGPVGTEVTITGENFSPNPDENTVTFDGAEANIQSASETELIVIVPDDATTGPVAVTVDGQTATGPEFTVTDDGGGGDAPTIDSIDPTEGPVGTAVTISGSNFSSTASENTVTFGGTEASVSAASTTELTAIVPEGLSTGAVTVEVTVNGQTATGPDFTVTDDGSGGDAPSIGGIDPTEGPVGTEVTITGENFSSTPSENTVTFNGAEATINSATETEIIAVVPDDATTGPVAVTVGGQTATGPEFTVTDDGGGGDAPTVDSINPTEGPTGTSVTITGSNFSSTASENTVEFGSEGATVTSASETELVAEVPSTLNAGDVVPVSVTVGGQTGTGPDFTVTDDGGGGDAPTIDGINPTEGPVGTEVTISGSNFSSTASENTVTFDGTEATVNSATETEIVAVVPDGATTGPVAVTVDGQTATGPEFTVTDDGGGGDAPTVDSINPTEGPTGTEVTITGSNFSSTASENTVEFGSEGATVNSATETEIVAVVPNTLNVGDVVAVSVTVNGQTGTGPDFTVTDGGGGGQEPSISGINPTEGPTGTEVTISGENFSSTTSENTVEFGGFGATVNSATETEIVAVVPDDLSAGETVDVTVAVDGQTATSPDQFTVTDDGSGGDAPIIDGIDPIEGEVGIEVTITGSNFASVASDNTVEFGGSQATVNSATETEIVAVVPGDLGAGAVDVTVTVDGQTATSPDQFTVIVPAPVIDAINPTEGEVGTAVTITGSNFGATASDNTVEFGGVEASINSASETEVVAVVPNSLGAGAVDVTLTANGQTVTAPQQFTVTVPAPVIDAIDPTSGTVGTEVTITGENFSSTATENTVTFGGTGATVNSATETEIVAVVPNSLSPGAYTVEVTVDGQTATGPDFTVLEEGTPQFPIIGSNASITHGSSGGCGGCGMTNEGNVIDSNTDTNFGQVEVSLGVAGGYYVSVESAGNIPSGGNAGFVVVKQGELIGAALLDNITITTYLDGTEQESASGSALLNLELVSGSTDKQFVSFPTSTEFDEIEIVFSGLVSASATYEVYAAYGGQEAEPVPGPAINSVSPERGPEGTEVTITGTNFSSTPSENTVTFDGVEATVNSATETELVVDVPAGATTGPLDVLVAGQTATYEDFVVGAVPLTGSDFNVETGTRGGCLSCDVTNGPNVIDEDLDNFATIEIALGVAGQGYVAVENTAATMPAGSRTGFLVARDGGTIDLGLIEDVTVETYLNGELQESHSGTGLLLLDLLSGTSTDRKFIGFEAATEFDQVVIGFNALVGADIVYHVYGAYEDYFVTE